MATTYTSLLGLALPATGELAGTWGSTVNSYLTSYVDAAIAGALTVTADTTLTQTNGGALGATSSQYAIIIASPASAAITITAPATSKTYIVINTSATYSVTFKASGQTGVVLAVSEKSLLVFNGTDFVKIGASAGGSSNQVQYNSGTGLAGSANFTFNGTGATSGYFFPSSATVPTNGMYLPAANTVGIATNSTAALNIDASQNVTIGAATSFANLGLQAAATGTATVNFVIKNSSTSKQVWLAQTASGYTYGGIGASEALLYANSSINIVADSGDIKFFANTGEKARFSSGGGLSVGTTSSAGAGGIYATGNITANFSDARLKDVIGVIPTALDKVSKLSGVYYTVNSTAKHYGYTDESVQVGVLAQEIEAVLPEIVKPAPFDLDENNESKSGKDYKTVQYERLVPLLIEAIKELKAEVDLLKGVK